MHVLCACCGSRLCGRFVCGGFSVSCVGFDMDSVCVRVLLMCMHTWRFGVCCCVFKVFWCLFCYVISVVAVCFVLDSL